MAGEELVYEVDDDVAASGPAEASAASVLSAAAPSHLGPSSGAGETSAMTIVGREGSAMSI